MGARDEAENSDCEELLNKKGRSITQLPESKKEGLETHLANRMTSEQMDNIAAPIRRKRPRLPELLKQSYDIENTSALHEDAPNRRMERQQLRVRQLLSTPIPFPPWRIIMHGDRCLILLHIPLHIHQSPEYIMVRYRRLVHVEFGLEVPCKHVEERALFWVGQESVGCAVGVGGEEGARVNAG